MGNKTNNIIKKVYFIGIGGIGISAIARYYLKNNYEVFGSDSNSSELILELKKEGANIIIGTQESRINNDLDLVIYTEAIPDNNPELKKTKELGIKTLTYPKALAKIANENKLIAIAGTHGKSTTTSLVSIVLKNSNLNFGAVVGSLLKEFDNKNFYFRKQNPEKEIFFVIEACEYKRSFLNYKPYIAILTNIELDHLDYYKDLDDYLNAFSSFIENIREGGFVVYDGNEENSRKLRLKYKNLRPDLNFIAVFDDYFTYLEEKFDFKNFKMQVPGSHIKYDAKLAYATAYILGLEEKNIIKSLESYAGIWRRMEIVGETKNKNLVISDYGHHPTEIKLTLKAIKQKYKTSPQPSSTRIGSNKQKKIFLIFQPHQYNRTLELLEDFKNSFVDCDYLVVPNIYESRDSEEDKKNMNTEIFLKKLNHKNKINGNGLENTLKIMQEYDKKNPGELVFVLMGAGNVDNLRKIVD